MKKYLGILLTFVLSMCLVGCSNSAEESSTAKVVTKNTYVVSINPEARIDEDTETGEILAIVPLNDDATNYYSNIDVSGKKLTDVVNEMVDICIDNGLINEENKDVNIVVLSYKGEDKTQLNENMKTLQAEVEEKYEGLVFNESKAPEYDNPDPDPEQTWIACPNCNSGIAKCPVCGGDWEKGFYHEERLCSQCEGGIVKEVENKEIYNGTPCKICGDVGTVDDGMHGGKRAECGECRGFGASHSVGDEHIPGGYNGDYASYAFSKTDVVTEHPCDACNGTGISEEGYYDPCMHCSHGEITCLTCEGKGGWMIED